MINNHTKFSAIVHYKQFGGTVRKIAKRYGVSKSSVSRWVNSNPDCVILKRRRRNRKCAVAKISDFVVQAMETTPHITAREIIGTIKGKFGLKVSEATISRCRQRNNYRFKRAQRAQQCQDVHPDHPFMKQQDPYDGAITLDESSFVSTDSPSMGWAKGSKRVPKGPPKRRKRVSLLLALDAEGVVAYKVIQGAFNGASYSEFLATLPSHRTIIADNCAIHRTRVAVEIAKQKHQTLLYTPPYCPWFNPVEFAFSKTKSAYRRARLDGRSDFVLDIQDALAGITAADCASFFQHARNVRQIELAKHPADV